MTVLALAPKQNLQAALYYADQGFHVFPIHSIINGQCTCAAASRCDSPGKHPRTNHGCKDATVDHATIEQWYRQWPNSGVGIATGPSGLVVVDVDPRNQGDTSLAQLPELPHTPKVLTGGGGYHFFFRKPPGEFKCGKLAQGIDIKADGGYVVAVPSAHISGASYRWDSDANVTTTPLADLPEWITLETLKPRRVSSGRVIDGFLGAAFEAAGWLGKPMGRDRTAALCPWQAEHTTGGPRDGSTIIFAPADNSRVGWGHCSHSHCQDRTQKEWIAALPEDAKAVARERLKMDADYTPDPDDKPAILATDAWTHSLTFDSKGKLTKDPGNAALLLAYEPGWAGCIAFDEFSYVPIWVRQPPPLDGLPLPKLGPFVEKDVVFIQQSLSKLRGVSFSKDAIFDAVTSAADEFPVHPVKDYLNLLEWDKIPRVERWLHTYLGVADTPYSRLVSAWFLISAVARVFEPGCPVHTVPILEGPQGAGKSTALQILAKHKHWFCDTPFDLGNKDAYMIIRGKWIIEMGELDGLSRTDAARAKVFFTSPKDTYRAPYSRTVSDVLRQCLITGTVNYNEYLHDETGARRYLPVECGAINLAALRRDVDMLWAEALWLFQSGRAWHPVTAAEKEICSSVQSSRYVSDEWESVIQDYISAHPDFIDFTSADVLVTILIMSPKDWTRADEMRVSKCLKRLGYVPVKINGRRCWKK